MLSIVDAGFDSFWLIEHHFTDDGYLRALMSVLAAIASRTRRVTLGRQLCAARAVSSSALRLTADIATVDVISNGRLRLGSGLGYRGEKFDGFGVARGERLGRTLLMDAMTGKAIERGTALGLSFRRAISAAAKSNSIAKRCSDTEKIRPPSASLAIASYMSPIISSRRGPISSSRRFTGHHLFAQWLSAAAGPEQTWIWPDAERLKRGTRGWAVKKCGQFLPEGLQIHDG